MNLKHLSFVIFAGLFLFAAPAGAQSQAPSPAQSTPAATATPLTTTNTPPLTAAEAQRALDALQDETKRADIIATLRAIAAAPTQTPTTGKPAETSTGASVEPKPTPAQPTSAKPAAAKPESAAAVAANGLGAQLLLQVSDKLGELSHAFIASAQTVTDFPLLWNWLQRVVDTPDARQTLVDIAWKLIVVLGAAIVVERLARWLLRRPLALLSRRAPAPAPPLTDDPALQPDPAPDAPIPTSPPSLQNGSTTPRRRSRHSITRSWRFLLRLPFVAAGLILELLPVAACELVGTVILGTQIGDVATPRLVILAVVNAYVLTRAVLCVVRTLISGDPLSFLTISHAAALSVERWTWRITTLAVFGIAFANVALLLGLYRPGYEALIKLVMLIVHVLVVIVILQCRATVAGLLRPRNGGHGLIVTLRNRFADVWHYLAAAIVMALWAVWAFNIQNGYTLLVHYFVGTAIVLAVARLASMVTIGTIERLYRVNAGALQGYPNFEARANRYLPFVNRAISTIVAAIACIALLEVWGVDAVNWFYNGQVGNRLVSAIVNIGVASIAALIVWEASNAMIDRHLDRLMRDLHYSRAARLRTFLPMLRTTLFCVVVTVVTLTTLSEIGVNVAPLLAGAGIVGIAIGFGSQKLVQDVITGLFLLIENVVQVGDFVTVAGLSGTVENLSIRTIRLRAGDGSVHVIPFSAVTSITNMNRGIGNAAISVGVSFEEDIDRVYQTLREIGAEMRGDPAFRNLIRGDLDLWGVDKVDGQMVSIIGQMQCTDAGRWPVQREFNRRMKQRFQEVGIEIARPVPMQTIVVQLPAQPKPDATAQAQDRPAS